MRRLLVPSAAPLWGLQFAFLNPALGLLLVALFDASPGEVGWVLAVYNASGFAAALVLPAYAARKGDYLPTARHVHHRRVRRPRDPGRDRGGGRAEHRHHRGDDRRALRGRPGAAGAGRGGGRRGADAARRRLYTNTRRVGAVVSGPVIAFGSLTSLGYGGVFAACAALTAVALVAVGVVARTARAAADCAAAPATAEQAG